MGNIRKSRCGIWNDKERRAKTRLFLCPKFEDGIVYSDGYFIVKTRKYSKTVFHFSNFPRIIDKNNTAVKMSAENGLVKRRQAEKGNYYGR